MLALSSHLWSAACDGGNQTAQQTFKVLRTVQAETPRHCKEKGTPMIQERFREWSILGLLNKLDPETLLLLGRVAAKGTASGDLNGYIKQKLRDILDEPVSVVVEQ